MENAALKRKKMKAILFKLCEFVPILSQPSVSQQKKKKKEILE